MFIIPLGPEEREVRRIPWITAALLAANLLVFVLVSFSPWADRAARHAEEVNKELIGYWIQHPYLEMPAEYARYVGSARATRERDVIGKALSMARSRGIRLPAPQDSVAEQAELEARASRWVEAMLATPEYALGFVPAHRTAVSLVSSMFMHGGWMHLLGNMVFLLMTAPLLEDRWGRILFPLFYLAAGGVSAFAQAVNAPDSLIPLIGASGAIAGVMGAFCVRLFRTRMVYLVWPIPIPFFLWRFRVRIPAWVVFPFWFLEQLVYNALVPDAGVAWSAHIAGFGFGVVFAFAMKAVGVEEKWIHPAIEKEIGWEQHPALTRAAELRAARDLDGARDQLRIALAAEPSNSDAWRSLFDLALDRRDGAESARAATRRLELLAAKGENDLALLAVAETLDHVVDELPSRFWMTAAAVRERSGEPRAAYEAYEASVCRFPHDPLAARALLKMAEILAAQGDPAAAWRVARLAQAHPGCLEGWREAADRLIVSLPPASAPSAEEPVPLRGILAPRGTRALPGAAVFAAAPLATPPPAPTRTAVAAGARSAASVGAAPVSSATVAASAAVGVATTAAAPAALPPVAPFARPAPAAAGLSMRAVRRPRLLWSAAGFAAAAIGAVAVLVWEPWARTAPARGAVAAAPRRASSPVPGTGAAAPVPAPPAAPAAGPEVPLRVTFQSPFPAGQVIVKAGERELLARDFDFGKESPGGLVDEVVVVPSGAVTLRVWITSRDRATSAYDTLAATIPADEPKSLDVALAGTRLVLAVK